jgi:quercetin 2,3-dioxygenase
LITTRLAEHRGHADHGWLNTYHSFSFADYYDPAHMGFRTLRVINEDWVQPGKGFGTHPHADMEIVTYVLEGALEHRDSMGNGSVIRPGEVQRMSAGTGITHSEFNASRDETVHLLQIWLLPATHGIQPSYEQKLMASGKDVTGLRVVASPDGRDGSVTIHTDASIYAGNFGKGKTAELSLAPGRHAWVQLARGRARVNGQALKSSDGAAISNETSVQVEGIDAAEVLVFDLP